MKAAASAALRAFADKKSEIVKYLLAFAAVMLIGAGLISFQGEDPVRALSAIWSGALGGRIEIGNTIRWIIPCVMTGMAAVVAFKSGVNNLGIEGQIYFGRLRRRHGGLSGPAPAGRPRALLPAGGGALRAALRAHPGGAQALLPHRRDDHHPDAQLHRHPADRVFHRAGDWRLVEHRLQRLTDPARLRDGQAAGAHQGYLRQRGHLRGGRGG